MAKHKKSKQISNKKKQKSKNNKEKSNNNNSNNNMKVPSVEELIQGGDAAAASMEGDKALAFYESANDLLLSKQQQQQMEEDHNTTLLSEQRIYVLEKLGETRVSFGDIDTAKQDFQTAISLMTTTTTATTTTGGTQQQQQQQQQQRNNPQWQETLAGLYLYVGQVSSEQEALEAYKKGLQCLEVSVELRQQECANTPAAITSEEDNDDDEMMLETDEKQESQGGDDDDDDKKKNNPAVALNEARQKLASARVTVAELYLTDLCFEENAESECESYVKKALEVIDVVDGEPMVDALQTAASLRLSQRRQQEATTLILKTYQKMKVGCEALAKLVGLKQEGDGTKSKRAVELVEVDAADNLPSIEFRNQTAKILLECGAANNIGGDDDDASKKNKQQQGGGGGGDVEETKIQLQKQQCHQAAIHVLGSLLAENDEIPEIWYLLGCAFEATKNVENAKYYWNKALEMLSAIQKQMEEEEEEETTDDADMGGGDDDDEAKDELEMQLQNIACQMEEIKSKLEDIEEEEDATMDED